MLNFGYNLFNFPLNGRLCLIELFHDTPSVIPVR